MQPAIYWAAHHEHRGYCAISNSSLAYSALAGISASVEYSRGWLDQSEMLWVIKQTNNPTFILLKVTYKSHQFLSLQLVESRISVKERAVGLGQSDCFKQLWTSFTVLPAYFDSRKWKFEVGPKSGFSHARSFCYPWPRNQQWMYKLQARRKFCIDCKVNGSWIIPWTSAGKRRKDDWVLNQTSI